MSNLALKAEARDGKEIGNRSARKLGRLNYIPAVMYGLNKEPVNIKVNKKDFTDLLRGHSISSTIFDIHTETDSKKKESVIVKEYQKDPISRELMHLDFLRIEMKKEIETSVPIRILNEDISVGIKESGGVLQHGLRELHISCLPSDIPEHVDYDIQALGMGETIRVEDIKAGDRVRIMNDPQEVIVSIIPPTQLREEEAVAEEVEAEEAREPEVIGKGKGEEAEESPGHEKKEIREEHRP
ncbi:MAG: 50S ribosomal protein L25 [Actinobacteria bacterium]|nr:50S ribosomal protein L25 [Actinomycetota bacterium]